MAHLIGGHTIDVGGIDMAARRAAAAGMQALQIFTAPPRFYGDKSNIRQERVERFRSALDEVGLDPRNVLVHGAYVLGVATPEEDKWIRASGGLTKELERSTAIGAGAICFHPGSAAKSPTSEAAKRVGRAITGALESVPGDTRVLVENTAGAGSTLGRTAGEIAEILASVPDDLRPRTGYGLDTCHLFASGYDIGRSEEHLREILDDFEKVTGEPPSFFHLNDSEGGLGTNRDRHALIGRGLIGVEPFRWLLNDPRSRGVPLILETPQKHPEVAEDDASADPWDAEMVELLKGLLPGRG
jgi:deoxyribonuclease IV